MKFLQRTDIPVSLLLYTNKMVLVWIFTLKTIVSFKPEQVIYKEKNNPTTKTKSTHAQEADKVFSVS